MVKWDAISWWATGIFVVSLVLGGAVHGAFLFLLLGAYLLRPLWMKRMGGGEEHGH